MLELVHSNICGPINPTSNGGKRYLITFIDYFSKEHGFIFYTRNQKLLPHLKASKLLYKMKQTRLLSPFEQIVAASIAQKSLKIFVCSMKFEESLQPHIHHNKMVSQRGKI